MCYPILGQRKLKANNVDRQLASRKAQSSSCFDLDSDRVAVLVPRQTEVSISVWGKPSELGNSLLSTHQRPFIYTGPQALSWRPSTIRSQVGPGSRLLAFLGFKEMVMEESGPQALRNEHESEFFSKVGRAPCI